MGFEIMQSEKVGGEIVFFSSNTNIVTRNFLFWIFSDKKINFNLTNNLILHSIVLPCSIFIFEKKSNAYFPFQCDALLYFLHSQKKKKLKTKKMKQISNDN